MPTHSEDAPRPLPERPNLRHLKDQAKDLLKAGEAESLTDAQFKIAQAIWICELAEVERARRFARGNWAAQVGDRCQRPRAGEESDDAQSGAASGAAWI